MNTYTKELYDRKGIPIMVGDLLKIYHYTAAQRMEKRYMYQWVSREVVRDRVLLEVSALNTHNTHFYLVKDGRVLHDTEIVQGYSGVEPGQTFRDRKRKT